MYTFIQGIDDSVPKLVASTNPELSLDYYLQPENGQFTTEDTVATPSAPTLQRAALQQTDYTPMGSFSSQRLSLISSSAHNDQDTLPEHYHISTPLYDDGPMGEHRQSVPARVRLLDASKPADSPSPMTNSHGRYPWKAYKGEIWELYIRQNRPLEDVMAVMEAKGFSPRYVANPKLPNNPRGLSEHLSKRSFRIQLDSWGFFKNNNSGKGRRVPDCPTQRPRTRLRHRSQASPSRPLPPARNEEI